MKFKHLGLLALLMIAIMSNIGGKTYPARPPQPTTVDCPQINDANISIIPSNCNASNGKILGITGTGTGTLQYTWYNSNKEIVGTDAELINAPAGKYYLQLRD